jgi:hypothetical protein
MILLCSDAYSVQAFALSCKSHRDTVRRFLSHKEILETKSWIMIGQDSLSFYGSPDAKNALTRMSIRFHLTAAMAEVISGLHRLRHLKMVYDDVTKLFALMPSTLSSLTELTSMDVSYKSTYGTVNRPYWKKSYFGELMPVGTLARLRELVFSCDDGNDRSDDTTIDLSHCSQLIRLDFKGSPGFDDFLQLPNTLQVLCLRDTYMTFSVSGIGDRLPFLRDLTLQGVLEPEHLVAFASSMSMLHMPVLETVDLHVRVQFPNVRRYRNMEVFPPETVILQMPKLVALTVRGGCRVDLDRVVSTSEVVLTRVH